VFLLILSINSFIVSTVQQYVYFNVILGKFQNQPPIGWQKETRCHSAKAQAQ
jgi:hypothetical protein